MLSKVFHCMLATASTQTHYKLGCYDFSLKTLYRLANSQHARNIKKLEFITGKLNKELIDYDIAHNEILDSSSEVGDDLLSTLTQTQQAAWWRGYPAALIGQRQAYTSYLNFVVSQAKFRQLIDVGILHECLEKLPSLESVSIQHEDTYASDMSSDHAQRSSVNFISSEVEWNTYSPEQSKYASDGPTLAAMLDALAHRADISTHSRLTELRMSIDTKHDFELPANRRRILESLGSVRTLHYGCRAIEAEICSEMQAILTACSGVEKVSTDHWGETWSEYGQDNPYSTHLTKLIHDNPNIWPLLRELSLERVEVTDTDLKSFFTAHCNTLKKLSIVNSDLDEAPELLNTVQRTLHLDEFHFEEDL